MRVLLRNCNKKHTCCGRANERINCFVICDVEMTTVLLVLFLFALAALCAAEVKYVAFNVGNAELRYINAKNKLVNPELAEKIREWFAELSADVYMISELCQGDQLFMPVKCNGTNLISGPLLNRNEYHSVCSPKENGNYECVAYKKKFKLIESHHLIYPAPCNNDFTAVGATLFNGQQNLTAITVHPPSLMSTLLSKCKASINVPLTWNFASQFKTPTVIGGDWNSVFKVVSHSKPKQFVPHIYEDCSELWPFGGCLDSTFVKDVTPTSKEWKSFKGCDHYALVGTIQL